MVFFMNGWTDWVNPSKRGGMDGVLQGLAGLLRGISRGRSPREIPRSSPASQMRTPLILTWIYILFKTGHFGDISDLKKNINV